MHASCTAGAVDLSFFIETNFSNLKSSDLEGKATMSDQNMNLAGGQSNSPESGSSNSREVLMALAKFGGLMAVLAIIGFIMLKLL